MTFTYTPETPTDVTRVRFHTGDTVAASAFFTDEEITFVISEQGSWQNAVVACLQSLIVKFARDPKFRADWLEVDPTASIAGLRALLAEKRKELRVNLVRSQARPVYRGDSLQTEAPEDWS
jgi:hypothetical protein